MERADKLDQCRLQHLQQRKTMSVRQSLIIRILKLQTALFVRS